MTATEMNMSKSGTAKAPKTLDAAITQQYAKYTPILGGIYQQALQNGLLPQTKALLNRMQSTQLGTANILSHLNGNRYDPGLAATLVGLSTAGRRLATNITASNDAARTNMLGQLQNLATGQAGAALNAYSSYQNALAKNADATAAAIEKIGKAIGDERVRRQNNNDPPGTATGGSGGKKSTGSDATTTAGGTGQNGVFIIDPVTKQWVISPKYQQLTLSPYTPLTNSSLYRF
jgi:uncharacterized protein YukE